MPPSSSMPTQTPTSSAAKNVVPNLAIVLSILMAVGLAVMYVKVDLLAKNMDTLAQRMDQKAPTPAPETSIPDKTPPPPSTATVVHTDPTTGLRFAVPNNYGPENYTFTKESIAGTELVSRISVKRAADGNIPECATLVTIVSADGPPSPDAIFVSTKYVVVAPAVDCEITVQERITPAVKRVEFGQTVTLASGEKANLYSFGEQPSMLLGTIEVFNITGCVANCDAQGENTAALTVTKPNGGASKTYTVGEKSTSCVETTIGALNITRFNFQTITLMPVLGCE